MTKLKSWRASALALAMAFVGTAGLAAPPAAVISDPPADKAHPAAMDYVRIRSHGDLINGVLYRASGAGPHPVVLLLHGFPGNEQNLDLAQAMRRAGYSVLTMHYRGSWGSPGTFSFTHAIEDTDAAIAFLRDAANARKYALDSPRLFLVGHSMGGFMAARATAHDPAIAGLVLISPWDIGKDGAAFSSPAARKAAAKDEFDDDVIPLAGTSTDKLMDEALANAKAWEFVGYAPALRTRPVLLVTADDGNGPDSHRLAEAMQKLGNKAVIETHFATDHPYSDHRIALASAVVGWLQRR